MLLSYQWKNHTKRGLLTLSFSFSMRIIAIFHKKYSFGAEISAHVEGVKIVMNTLISRCFSSPDGLSPSLTVEES